MILMTDTIIDQVDLLGKYQREILVFTDCKICIIGDGDTELTGLDGDGALNEPPLKIENKNDIDYQEDFHHKKEDQTIQKPVRVELDPL